MISSNACRDLTFFYWAVTPTKVRRSQQQSRALQMSTGMHRCCDVLPAGGRGHIDKLISACPSCCMTNVTYQRGGNG